MATIDTQSLFVLITMILAILTIASYFIVTKAKLEKFNSYTLEVNGLITNVESRIRYYGKQGLKRENRCTIVYTINGHAFFREVGWLHCNYKMREELFTEGNYIKINVNRNDYNENCIEIDKRNAYTLPIILGVMTICFLFTIFFGR